MNTELNTNTDEMQVDTKRMVKSFTLNDILNIFIRRVLFIILIPAVLAGGMYFLDLWKYEPMYESTATMYILRQDSKTVDASDVASDFSLALKVVNDCTYMLKGHTVIDSVRENLDLDMAYNDLFNSISTYNPENTRILEVTVKAASPELAKEIVDNLCSVGVGQINDTMGFEQINLYEKGVYNPYPCNVPRAKKHIVIGIVLAGIIFLVFMIIYLLDDTIEDDEEIQKYLGLSILGDIPNSDEANRKKYGYGKYGYRKYGYRKYGYRKHNSEDSERGDK